jgi:hypothetical protein
MFFGMKKKKRERERWGEENEKIKDNKIILKNNI